MMQFLLAAIVALTTYNGVQTGPAAVTDVCRSGATTSCSSCSHCNSSTFTSENFENFDAALAADHWMELVNSEPDLIVWKHKIPSATTIRAKVRFAVENSDVNSIVALLTDSEKRRQWDAVTVKSETIGSCNDHYQILYSVMKIAQFALDRDFVQAVGHQKTSDGCTIVLRRDVVCPCPSRYCPDPTGAVVRGKVGQSGAKVCPPATESLGGGTVIELLLDYDIGERTMTGPSESDAVTTAAQLLLTTWFRNLVNHVNSGRSTSRSAAAAAANKMPFPFHKHFADNLIRDEYDCDPDAGWRILSNTTQNGGASVCARHWDGTNAFAFKSFHVVADARPCDVAKMLTNYAKRPSWDRTFPKIDVVEKHRHYHVIYWVLGLPPPYVNRDVVLYTTVRRLKDGGYAILYRNAGQNECRRPVAGLVRAVAYPSAVFVRPTTPPGNGSIVSYNLHMDIGPGVPVKAYENMLRGRSAWTGALEGHYKRIGGKDASIESDFDIAC